MNWIESNRRLITFWNLVNALDPWEVLTYVQDAADLSVLPDIGSKRCGYQSIASVPEGPDVYSWRPTPRDCAPAERDVSVQQPTFGSAGAVINLGGAWL